MPEAAQRRAKEHTASLWLQLGSAAMLEALRAEPVPLHTGLTQIAQALDCRDQPLGPYSSLLLAQSKAEKRLKANLQEWEATVHNQKDGNTSN